MCRRDSKRRAARELASRAVRRFTSPRAALLALMSFGIVLTPSIAGAIEPPVSKPVNTAAPVLTGTPSAGKVLSCTPGSWTNNPTVFSYAWLRDGAPISGQASSTYTVQSADLGHTLGCQVTAGKQVGEYTISGLATGSYKVEFFPGEGNYLTQYFNGKGALAEATPVSTTAGSTTPGINGELPVGGQISGRATDASTHSGIGKIFVCAAAATTSKCDTTNSVGEYTISRLPSGSYKVTFESSGGYLVQYYNGKSSSGEANPVAVTAGVTTGSIDAELLKGGQIKGTVVEAGTTTALPGIEACAYLGGNYAGCTNTDSSGEYTISGLATGSYTVKFSAGSSLFGEAAGNYVTQYFNGKTTEGEANPVSVTVPSTTSGINAEMHHGGQIAGTVTDAVTHFPLEGILACADDAATKVSAGCAVTNEAGHYTLNGLSAGSYKVVFVGNEGFGFGEGSPYLSQFYNNKTTEGEADSVAVTLAKTTSGIDAEMHTGGHIAGKVTDASTHVPLANIYVCATEAGAPAFNFFFDCATTNASGEYVIAGLSSGSYVIEFSAGECEENGCAPANYQTQFYSGKTAEGEANSVAVSAPSTTVGINAEMHIGGLISGSVIGALEKIPLGGVTVCALHATDNSFGGCASTNTRASAGSATSNALTIPLPNSNFSLAKRPVFNPKTGEIDFFFAVSNPGTFRWGLSFRNSDVGFADALGLSLDHTGVAEAARRRKARSKHCKAGFIKHGRRCVHAKVSYGAGSASVPAGTVEVKVRASSRAIKGLNAGHTLHVSGPFTFQSALGGSPVTHTESVTVRKPKKHSRKYRKHRRH
jgi:hypothetical protein